MANFTIKLYSFTKRENSTAQPSGAGTDVSGVMIDNTSMMRPSFRLQLANTPNYNYAYISEFGRYYFIDDWQIDNAFWVASMRVDVLATYKAAITAGTHYVLRSASKYNTDGDIIDDLYPTMGQVLVSNGGMINSPFDSANITNIIGLINNTSSNKFGAVSYYAVSETNLGELMDYLLGGSTYGTQVVTGVEGLISTLTRPEVQDAIAKSLTNPEQYLTESYMLPYRPDTSGPGRTLHAGWFTLPSGITGSLLTANTTQETIDTVTLDIPEHPQAQTRGLYLNLSPYSRYWLYLGPFGIVPLDSSLIYKMAAREVTCEVLGDLMGNITCKITLAGQVIDIVHANVKCNFPVAQTTMDMSRMAGSVASVVGSLGAMAAGVPSGALGIASGIVSAAEACMPQVRSQGSQGTFVNVFDQWGCFAACQYVVDEMIGERGRPLCEAVTLSTLSGYCLCADADVAISGTDAEAAKINNYLNSGFYID